MSKPLDFKCCKETGCKKEAKRGGLCWKHAKRIWRRANPEKATYGNLKSNAKRRGKVCTLTFEEFLEEINGTKYMEEKGRTAESLSLDRKEYWRGYEKGNIEVMTASNNGIKGNEEKRLMNTERDPRLDDPDYLPF